MIDYSSIAFAITTYYPKWYRGNVRSNKHTDKIRGDLALEFFRAVRDKGSKLIIVDGHSSASFKRELSKITWAKVFKRISHKRSPNKRLAIRKASQTPGVEVIIITEAEKVSLITDCLVQISNPIFHGDADVVVPKREERLFRETYPDYMYASEIEGMIFYNEIVKLNGILPQTSPDLDWYFGPRVFRNDQRVVHLFTRKYGLKSGKLFYPHEYFDPDQYSNNLYFPIVQALRKKFNIVSVTVPFKYPKSQKINEEKGAREIFIEKRRYQRLSILFELLHFVSFLDKKPHSKFKQHVERDLKKLNK